MPKVNTYSGIINISIIHKLVLDIPEFNQVYMKFEFQK